MNISNGEAVTLLLAGWTSDLRVTSLTPALDNCYNPGQVIHTYVSLSLSSIICYQLRMGVTVLTNGYRNIELDTELLAMGLCRVIWLIRRHC